MNNVSIQTFEQAICATHDAAAKLADRVLVVETFEGVEIWRGEVFVFDLQGHPTAQRCYCWELGGRVTAVLHTGPINSPVMAVRASILAAGPEPEGTG